MADLRSFLADIEDDVRSYEELTEILLTLHDHGTDTFTPAQASGIMRVLYLQQDHARSLLVKYADAEEAVRASRRHAHG